MTVNGVVVRADRAGIEGSEVTLDGNVRMTFPQPFDTAAALRKRVAPAVAPVPPPPSKRR
jgi:hypothetical protein